MSAMSGCLSEEYQIVQASIRIHRVQEETLNGGPVVLFTPLSTPITDETGFIMK